MDILVDGALSGDGRCTSFGTSPREPRVIASWHDATRGVVLLALNRSDGTPHGLVAGALRAGDSWESDAVAGFPWLEASLLGPATIKVMSVASVDGVAAIVGLATRPIEAIEVQLGNCRQRILIDDQSRAWMAAFRSPEGDALVELSARDAQGALVEEIRVPVR